MGKMKICVPIMGRYPEEMKEQAALARDLPCDIIEMRADFMTPEHYMDMDIMRELVREVKAVSGKPLIYTLRTAGEGGWAVKLTRSDYLEHIRTAAEETDADIVDIEGFGAGDDDYDPERTALLCGLVNQCGKRTIVSSHDMDGTPPVEDIVIKFCALDNMGGDILKVAVFARSEEDTYALLEASRIFHENYSGTPLIAIAMGEAGKTSRICGGDFGSVMTFASGVAQSAPGQMPAAELRQAIDEYYGEK
ncbi:MAG: type I 3-dehydroquinate dehydratase [Anaerovoracaceae bacterium]|nr:type I 3-dehydroquinate dehydratase [Anaerovoracaceae bacterium]